MVATIVYLAVCPSVLSYLFFNRGVELIGANRAGPFFHLTPCFVVVMAVIFLGEEPAIHHAIGFALILTGVWIASRRPPARPSDPAAVKNRVAPEAPLN
jgi:drug/metabolite transporter (DMT)-like permease